jgi:protein-tyrosine-phosphatase
LRSHRDLLAESDLVVTMTAEQREVVATFPEAAGRTIVTLRELAGEDGDIKDPVGQGEERYRACRDEIARCLTKSIDRLLVPPAGRSG